MEMQKILLTLLAIAVIILLLFQIHYSNVDAKKDVDKNVELLKRVVNQLILLKSRIDSLEMNYESKLIETIKGNKFLTATSYSSLPSQCWGNPHKTASGTHVSFQTLAFSQDMISHWHNHKPRGKFCYGDTVWVLFLKAFVVEDTMHPRFERRMDVWNDDLKESILFGRQMGFIIER